MALGGDGTANEVVNGLPAGVGFSMLPGGASSVFARQIGFTDEPLTAAGQLARALAQGHARTIGLGQLDGRRFTFAASVGFDAEAIRAVDDARWGRRGYRRPGDLRVVVALLRALRADGYVLRERMTVAVAGRTPARAAYLAVGNQHPYTYFGRLPVRAVPRAGFDSALDAVAVHAARTRDLWLIGGYALVWARHASRGSALADYLHDVRTSRWSATFRPPSRSTASTSGCGGGWRSATSTTRCACTVRASPERPAANPIGGAPPANV